MQKSITDQNIKGVLYALMRLLKLLI